jgi:hypothetical protein
MSYLPKYILDRDGNLKGQPTGSIRPCNLEGCGGRRIGVRWPKEEGKKRAKITFPCTKGMKTVSDSVWQIL